jgi:hypothetical protein
VAGLPAQLNELGAGRFPSRRSANDIGFCPVIHPARLGAVSIECRLYIWWWESTRPCKTRVTTVEGRRRCHREVNVAGAGFLNLTP